MRHVLAAIAGADLIVVVSFVYLWARERKRYLGLWAAAWGCNGLWHAVMLHGHISRGALMPPAWSPVPIFAGFLIFLAGTYAFGGRSMPRAWAGASLAVLLGLAAGGLAGAPQLALLIVAVWFVAIQTAVAGVLILRTAARHGLGPHATGWIAILQAAHMTTYPFLGTRESTAPAAWLVAALLETLFAVGVILLHAEQARAETRQVQQQLFQSQKMEAMGRLTGSVAHDFNNLLAVVLAATARLRPTASSLQATHVATITEAAERAAELVRHLLTFSRRQVIELRPVELSALVHDAAGMLQGLLGAGVELELDATAPAYVLGDAVQLQQVLYNLAANARDAMPEGGRLRVEVRREPNGNQALLRVADSGHGMSPETVERIFEPYFTTKGPGQGAGLGLATVYGIVRQCGGTIAVDSRPGGGTTFSIYLRLAAVAPLPALAPRARSRDDSILVVEDDLALQAIFQHVLADEGYEVVLAGDGEEALERLRASPAPPGLLVTDLGLPRLGGEQVIAAARRLWPELPALAVSGNPARLEAIGGPCLGKPFSPDDLRAAVRRVLPPEAATTGPADACGSPARGTASARG